MSDFTYSPMIGVDQATGLPRPPWVETACRTWVAAHPTCVACGGNVHLNAHHEYPWSWPGGDSRENSDPNPALHKFVTLCEKPSMNCHLWIGHLGDFKSRNVTVEHDALMMLDKVKHRPYPNRTEGSS